MSFEKNQLMDNRSEQSGDEMDGEDAETVRSGIRNRIGQKEKERMIAFLVQHFRKHFSIRSLSRKYAEFRGTGISSETYRHRFSALLIPNIHRIDCSVKTKLEIYQKFRIKANKGYIEELKKHADITLEEGVVVEFKMKMDTEKVEEPGEVDGHMPGSSSRSKRTIDCAAEADSAKKARNEGGFEEEDEKYLIFDGVLQERVPHPELSTVYPKNEQIQQPVRDEGDFCLGQYNDYHEEYDPNFGDNGMEARMMAAMREMMHGFMGTINKKFAASEKKMAGMQSEIQKIAKKQDATEQMISEKMRRMETAVKNMETGMSTKIDSLQREVNAIREASEASNSPTIGSIGHVSRESNKDDPEPENSPRNELSPGDIQTEDTTAPIVEAIKESNKDLVETVKEMATTIKDAIKSIGERSGSQIANPQQPGPSEPNQKLTFLKTTKK